MKQLFRISLLLIATILAGCGVGTIESAGGPAETAESVVKTGDLVSESGIKELASDNEIDEDAEKNVITEEETQIADPVLDEKPLETAKKPSEEESDKDDSKDKTDKDDKSKDSDEDTSDETAEKDDSTKDTDEDADKDKDKKDDSTEEPEEKETADGSAVTSPEEDLTTAFTGKKVDFTLDTTQGRWFETPEKEIISEGKLNSNKNQIKALRNRIKAIKKKVRNGQLDKETARAQIKELRAQIAAKREIIGSGGKTQKGIHTYWANQSLNITINEGESGWYKLVVVAKNLGPLPAGYDNFGFTLLDKSNEDMLGNFSVKARENVYRRGRLIFKLDDPSGKVLDLLWNNDALDKKGDANVQIKAIRLKKIKEPKFSKKPIRKGDEYSYLDGRWFFDKKTAYTYWANQTIGYTYHNLKGGTYELEIMAMNRSENGLPEGYEGFKVEINTENNSDEVLIKANDKKWNKEKVTLILPEGDSTIYLTWLNEKYLEDQYDANIQIKQIKLKRTADSGMTAYLLKTTSGNRMIIMSILALLLITIASISIYNRRRTEM